MSRRPPSRIVAGRRPSKGRGSGPSSKSGAATDAPHPAGIAGGSLLAWWTADRPDLITTTGAGVSSWRDTVAGYNLVQGTDAARPVYSATSFNGSPSVTFDGTDDFLSMASQPFPQGASPFEVWLVVQQDAAEADADTRRVFAFGGASNQTAVSIAKGATVSRPAFTIGTGGGTADANTGSANFDTRHVVRVVATGTVIRMFLDGVSTGADVAAIGAVGATLVRMGVHPAADVAFWQGKVRDALVTGPLTANQASALEAWLLPRRAL